LKGRSITRTKSLQQLKKSASIENLKDSEIKTSESIKYSQSQNAYDHEDIEGLSYEPTDTPLQFGKSSNKNNKYEININKSIHDESIQKVNEN